MKAWRVVLCSGFFAAVAACGSGSTTTGSLPPSGGIFADTGDPGPFGGSGNPGPFSGSGDPGPFSGSGAPGPFSGSGNPGPSSGSGAPGSVTRSDCESACGRAESLRCKNDGPSVVAVCIQNCTSATTIADAQYRQLFAALIACLSQANLVCDDKGHASAPGCNFQSIPSPGAGGSGNGGRGGSDNGGRGGSDNGGRGGSDNGAGGTSGRGGNPPAPDAGAGGR
jgi:hypothetical protein